MAGRSEEIEALFLHMEDLVAMEFMAASFAKFEEGDGKSADDRLEVTVAVAKAGRAVKLFRGAGARAMKAIAALRAPNAVGAEENAMNDDARWTPERIADLHAKVRERMAKFAGSRELKHLVERDRIRAGKSAGAATGDAAVQGGAPVSAD